MNLEDLSRKLQQSGKADRIKQIAQSEEGARLSSMINPAAVEAAAKSGDQQALKNLLSGILSTEDGRKLADNLRKIMEE